MHALDLIGVHEAPGTPPVDHGLIAWATDGVLLSLIVLALLGILLFAALRECRRPVVLSLLGVLVGAALLRWLLPVETSFTAWPFKRAVPLALAMYEGPVLPLLSGWFDLTIYLDDLIFETNRWMAILSPLVFFLHARRLLRDDWAAVAAAALLAVHPSHLRHAASDVLFIQSIFFSSLAFAALYTYLEESRRWWGIAAGVAFPILAVICYESRPLNIIFAPLFLAAIFLTTRGHGVSRRVALVGVGGGHPPPAPGRSSSVRSSSPGGAPGGLAGTPWSAWSLSSRPRPGPSRPTWCPASPETSRAACPSTPSRASGQPSSGPRTCSSTPGSPPSA